jgi:hypothetical protein
MPLWSGKTQASSAPDASPDRYVRWQWTDERLLESDGVVDVDMDRGVNRDAWRRPIHHHSDPLPFRRGSASIVVITELMQMEAGRTAGDRADWAKTGTVKRPEERNDDQRLVVRFSGPLLGSE